MSEQSMDALRKANQVRYERADLKRDLIAGTVTLAQVLERECVENAPVRDVLAWQPGWGTYRITRVLNDIGISLFATVGRLTARQRRALVGLPADPPLFRTYGWCSVCEEPTVLPVGASCPWCETRLIDPGLAA